MNTRTRRPRLIDARPDLVKQWCAVKNPVGVLETVTLGSDFRATWRCDKGHSWEATVSNRVREKYKGGCARCRRQKVSPEYNLAVTNPELAAQLHPSKNGTFNPFEVTPKSTVKVWWVCDKGHEWEAAIYSRSRGCGCPYCSGARVTPETSLAVKNPDLAAEWHPTNNGTLTPWDVTPGSGKQVWWLCHNNHAWRAAVNYRSRGDGCTYCGKRRVSPEYNLEATHPQLSEEWHPTKNGDIHPRHITAGSNLAAWWRCECGHEWQARVRNRAAGKGCRMCAEYGYQDSREGVLYLLHDRRFDVYKLGITNDLERRRIELDKALGREWYLVGYWHSEDGSVIRHFECEAKQLVRTSQPSPPLTRDELSEGWTETFTADATPPTPLAWLQGVSVGYDVTFHVPDVIAA